MNLLNTAVLPRSAGGDIGSTATRMGRREGRKILTAGRWGAMNVEVKDGKMFLRQARWRKPYRTPYSLRRRSGTHHGAYSASDGEKKLSRNPLQPAKGRGEDTYVQVSWDKH